MPGQNMIRDLKTDIILIMALSSTTTQVVDNPGAKV